MSYKEIISKCTIDNEEKILVYYKNLNLFNRAEQYLGFSFYEFKYDCFFKANYLNSFTSFPFIEDIDENFKEKAFFLNYYNSRFCGVSDKLEEFFMIDQSTIIACKNFLGLDLLLTYDRFYVIRQILFNKDMSISGLDFISIESFCHLAYFSIKEIEPTTPILILIENNVYLGIYPLKNNCYLSVSFEILEDASSKDTVYRPTIFNMDYFHMDHNNLISLTENFPDGFSDYNCLEHILNFVTKDDYDNFTVYFENLLKLL